MMKKWIAAFMAVICSFLGVYDYGEEQIAQGYELMEEGDYAGANEEFEAALVQAEKTSEKNPDQESEKYVTAEAYRGLGMSAYELQDYQHCVEYLQMALEAGEEPTAIMYHLMGISSMKLEDYESALVYLEQGIELQENLESLNETYKEMRYNKVVCYEGLMDWESAKAEAEAYIALYPDDTEMQKEYTFLKTR